jgi:tetratricopeptide (TPR) repeat protein
MNKLCKSAKLGAGYKYKGTNTSSDSVQDRQLEPSREPEEKDPGASRTADQLAFRAPVTAHLLLDDAPSEDCKNADESVHKDCVPNDSLNIDRSDTGLEESILLTDGPTLADRVPAECSVLTEDSGFWAANGSRPRKKAANERIGEHSTLQPDASSLEHIQSQSRDSHLDATEAPAPGVPLYFQFAAGCVGTIVIALVCACIYVLPHALPQLGVLKLLSESTSFAFMTFLMLTQIPYLVYYWRLVFDTHQRAQRLTQGEYSPRPWKALCVASAPAVFAPLTAFGLFSCILAPVFEWLRVATSMHTIPALAGTVAGVISSAAIVLILVTNLSCFLPAYFSFSVLSRLIRLIHEKTHGRESTVPKVDALWIPLMIMGPVWAILWAYGSTTSILIFAVAAPLCFGVALHKMRRIKNELDAIERSVNQTANERMTDPADEENAAQAKALSDKAARERKLFRTRDVGVALALFVAVLEGYAYLFNGYSEKSAGDKLASIYFTGGCTQAIEAYSAAVKKNPYLAEAWIGEGNGYLRLSSIAETNEKAKGFLRLAAAAYDKALVLPRQQDQTFFRNFAVCENALGHTARARYFFDLAIEERSPRKQWFYERGNLHRAEHRYQAALNDYEIASDPDEDALQSAGPHEAEGLEQERLLAVSQMNLLSGRYAKSIEHIEKLEPKLKGYGLKIQLPCNSLTEEQLQLMKAQAVALKGDYDQARKDLDQSVASSPSFDSLVARGAFNFAMGDYTSAVSDYNATHQLTKHQTVRLTDYQKALLLKRQSQVFAAQGNYTAAIEAASSLADLAPSFNSLFQRAQLYFKAGDSVRARADLARAGQLCDSGGLNADERQTVGDNYESVGAHAQARKCWNEALRAVKIGPNGGRMARLDAHLQRAGLYEKLSEHDLAAQEIDLANKIIAVSLADSSKYAYPHQAHGELLLKNGNTTEAIKELELALTCDMPDVHAAYGRLAEAYRKLGNKARGEYFDRQVRLVEML